MRSFLFSLVFAITLNRCCLAVPAPMPDAQGLRPPRWFQIITTVLTVIPGKPKMSYYPVSGFSDDHDMGFVEIIQQLSDEDKSRLQEEVERQLERPGAAECAQEYTNANLTVSDTGLEAFKIAGIPASCMEFIREVHESLKMYSDAFPLLEHPDTIRYTDLHPWTYKSVKSLLKAGEKSNAIGNILWES